MSKRSNVKPVPTQRKKKNCNISDKLKSGSRKINNNIKIALYAVSLCARHPIQKFFLMFLFLFFAILIAQTSSTTLTNGNLTLTLTISPSNGLFLELSEATSATKLTGRIGIGIKFALNSKNHFVSAENDIQFYVNNDHNGFNIHFETLDKSVQFQDCFTIDQSDSWFMAREGNPTEWPIQKTILNSTAYIVSEDNPIWEPYWLNSKGAFIFVNESTPLFVDQNNINLNNLCLLAKLQEPYLNRDRVVLNYTIGAGANAREGHLLAITSHVGKPFQVPNVEMMRFPTWSTLVKFGNDLNAQLLYDFAESVKVNGFRGQIQVEDGWEECYGSLEFNKKNFPRVEYTLMEIHNFALKIIISVHPFINKECKIAQVGLDNGYLIKDEISWWNGKSAYLIDFTNENATAWFSERVNALLGDNPLEGLVFQAGEASWVPKTSTKQYPNSLTTNYNALTNISTYMSVHSGWRTQPLPVFITIPDKESNWSQENGLKSVIINLFQLNFAGYTMVSPGVIGGKSVERPSPELFVRWVQAVTFMPVMKFGHMPWEIISPSFDVFAITQKFIDLHYSYSTKINNVMKKSWTMGLPVNGPIWWIEPTKPSNFEIIDQFMLGEDVLIAPVLTEGATSRDIYLPPGTWEDGQNYTQIYYGNTTLKNYFAPIDVLPFFTLRKD